MSCCYSSSLIADEQQQQLNYTVTTAMQITTSIQILVFDNLSNLCRVIFVVLLLVLCNCVVATTKIYIKHMLLCNCVVATSTKLYIKHNKNKNKKINLHTFSVQLEITQSFCCCWSCSSCCCFCCYCVILLLQ